MRRAPRAGGRGSRTQGRPAPPPVTQAVARGRAAARRLPRRRPAAIAASEHRPESAARQGPRPIRSPPAASTRATAAAAAPSAAGARALSLLPQPLKRVGPGAARGSLLLVHPYHTHAGRPAGLARLAPLAPALLGDLRRAPRYRFVHHTPAAATPYAAVYPSRQARLTCALGGARARRQAAPAPLAARPSPDMPRSTHPLHPLPHIPRPRAPACKPVRNRRLTVSRGWWAARTA